MNIDNGPIHLFGNMSQILSAPGQGQQGSVLVPDPNDDRGPSLSFMGLGSPDIRFAYLKDKVAGYTGVVPAHLDLPFIHSVDAIPAAFQTNNICAAQNVVVNVAMTLAAASTGISLNVPIVPFAGFGGLNSAAPVTAGIALDFGFAFGTTVAANTTMLVADSTQFVVGMPLVIPGAGNAAGTTCLLTNVASITDATHIVVRDAPLAAVAAAPIGTGNIWGPSENGFPTPTAALPYQAIGPALLLDPQQALSRGVQITGVGGSAGGTFLVAGWDRYGMAMTQIVTVGAGAVSGFSTKCFKYIASVTPQFTDAHNYSVGTADVFDFCVRSDRWEFSNVCWNGAFMTSSQGWVAGDKTSPATNLRNDVRGTIQTSAQGGGTGIGVTASSGTIVSLAMSGVRLVMFQSLPLSNVIRGLVTDTRPIYGVTQA